MKKTILAACLAATLAIPAVTLADQATAKPAAAKPLSETNTVERRATITAINAASRVVTLQGENGAVIELEVSPEVQNFDKLKIGDVVAATYTESLALHIAAPGEATPGIKESVSGTPSPGQRQVGREVTATFKIEAIDAKANKVTLSDGAGHSRVVDVVNPKVQERLKTLKPGQMAVITYKESLALRLEKVATK
jgi:Cu/Ag efflux protein CusF